MKTFLKTQATGDVKPAVEFAGMFGARPVIVWHNTQPGARLTMPFDVAAAGRYAVRLTAGVGPEYGISDIAIDGRIILTNVDFHAAVADELDLNLGLHEFTEGTHELAFCAVATAGNPAKPLAVEMLRLLALPPEARRAVKSHHEAHFIRLYLGRAIFAYRLAYDELPESLDMLVEAGLLPERLLLNENEMPLIGRREGSAFVVACPHEPTPWTHSWQGLDARR